MTNLEFQSLIDNHNRSRNAYENEQARQQAIRRGEATYCDVWGHRRDVKTKRRI